MRIFVVFMGFFEDMEIDADAPCVACWGDFGIFMQPKCNQDSAYTYVYKIAQKNSPKGFDSQGAIVI